MTIDYFSLGHPLVGLRSHYAIKARRKMFDLFMSTMRVTPDSKILDLGVTPDRSLKESNFFEHAYPHKTKLTAASIEDACWLEQAFPGIKFVQIQPGRLPFADNQFDIVYSSAVIEHVGDRQAQEFFVSELLRVSRRFFVATPNRQYPLEFHTFLPLIHWLPRAAHQSILRVLGLKFWARTENLNLLSPTSFVRLFPRCRSLHLYKHRLLGLPSNLVVYGEK